VSVTVVNEWRFLEGADLDEGMAAIREYMAYLSANERELEQSLWLKTKDDPLQYFHVATFGSEEALERQKGSNGTRRFVERLYPLIDGDSVKQPAGPVVANLGRGPGDL